MDPTKLNLDGLTLSDEGLTLNLEAEPETAADLDHCLIGGVLADREIQFAYFSERMSRAWKPGKRVTITKSVADRYLFQFHHKVDDARVLEEGPWLYDNFHIVLDRIAPSAVPNLVPLNHIEFWVQVHGLPFGFVQPKVGQGIGSFLGTLKAYDVRNTIHSSYMRIKVAIDVTVPLKKEWRVRASNGNFVTVNFKYEKLGVFCHRCGVLGHTDKVCPELFELDSDDGVRNWGPYLKPVTQRVGTAATNRWLQDPIPAVTPSHNSDVAAASVGRKTQTAGTGVVTNFHDRMTAFQTQLTAMRHDVLAAQNAVLVKKGKGAHSACQVHLLPSSSTGTSASNLLPDRPIVLGLPAAPL
ncbi:uncharacterized protein [Medicago truncatula]|uniref:uncharacterized protein n=1 Tax=Medicago truncatula TaxID=3880 RepID=UPI0000F6EC5D|nr:uncharacterized protein LOC120576100 [Medicago truncatula]